MIRSRLPFSWVSRLLLSKTPLKPYTHHPISTLTSNPTRPRFPTRPMSPFLQARHFCVTQEEFEQGIEDMLAEVERQKNMEREAKRKAGINVDEEEEEEDYMGVGPIIEKDEKKLDSLINRWGDYYIVSDEESDSGTECDDDDEERAREMEEREEKLAERKVKRHEEIIQKFVQTKTLDDAFKWMARLDKFEEKHYNIRPEYRVIGELMNRFKVSTGKEKFMLANKLNRAFRLVQRRETFDTSNPANYSVMQKENVHVDEEEADKDSLAEGGWKREDEEVEFDDMKERDDILIQKLSEIDKKLEEKLAALDHTFGKKGKLLEGEIRDLAEERNSLTEKKRVPMYRKGFDIHLVDMNRTVKVTKGGQVVKYSAILACGNYNGVVGYAKGKGPAVPIALEKAYEKCFQNLHHFDLYEDHTIPHAIQTTYGKTKVYLWPAKTTTGMKAGRTVQTILNLVGLKNVKSKVIGSRNPHNTVKAVFKALNAIETPKDVQEKFGRTVVETYLL